MFPVVVGTAFKNKGVQPLLDAVVDYLPSPLDTKETHGLDPDNGQDDHAQGRRQRAVLGAGVQDHGRSVCRPADVYPGLLRAAEVGRFGAELAHAEARAHRAPAEDARQQARRHSARFWRATFAPPSDLKNVSTGDTICEEKHPITLESITFAVPVISVAVEPKTKADQEKMGMALAKLAQEDPTFKVHTDPDSGQTIISGMGELHLEIIVDRMMREYKVEANVGKPQVAYRETIRRHSEAEGKYIRQTGGSGQYGHAKIYLDPQPPGMGYEFVNDIVGGSVPKEFIKPIDQGIQEALEGGILAGYPMVDVKATLYDGSYHDVDSNEMAFKIAGSMAFKEAARKASPVLLEPVMAVEVVTPGRLRRSDHGRFEFAPRAH